MGSLMTKQTQYSPQGAAEIFIATYAAALSEQQAKILEPALRKILYEAYTAGKREQERKE